MAEDNRNKPLYMISVAAELTGMHPQTLRVYESKGLVNPQRSGAKIKYNNNKVANKYAAHLCENLSKVKGKFSVTCQQEIVHNMWKNGLTSIAQDGFVKLFSIF